MLLIVRRLIAICPQEFRAMVKPLKKDPVLLEFGRRVSDERDARGWTQAFLAEKVGVDRTYIGIIERAEKSVGLRIINRLALVLGERAVGFVPCRLKRLPKRLPRRLRKRRPKRIAKK
jgi:transcriptional regulator with XRE-family HTH domain